MKVEVIAHTPDMETVVAAAARLCYSEQGATELMKNFTSDKVEKFVKKLVSLGHESPMEHASITFAIEGISRACSHQLVRHRVGASYSQKSQRYVKEDDFDYIIPPSIAKDVYRKNMFDCAMDRMKSLYVHLIKMGVSAEDARFILPNATATSLVVTMNVRSLWHFFELRCCNRAQWEIRALANEMLKQAREIAPLLFAKAGATCDTVGICFEGNMCCGKCKNVAER